MIRDGVAPCTAMVFVWSQLTRGDPNYTLAQISLTDLIMVFEIPPSAAFLLGVADVAVPWQTLLLSTALYVLLASRLSTQPTAWLRRSMKSGVIGPMPTVPRMPSVPKQILPPIAASLLLSCRTRRRCLGRHAWRVGT
jgi:hypothetical protein